MTSKPAVEVVGSEGKSLQLMSGQRWPLPYRGSRYSVRQVGRALRVVWRWQDVVVPSTNYPGETIRALRDAHKPRGSFCITPHGLLISKVPVGDGGQWKPVFIGESAHDIQFTGVDLDPKNMKMGMYWTGFPFHCGETWFVSPREGADAKPMWKHEGICLGSTKRYPELYRQYLAIRSVGGRLYITDHGHIWMNLRDKEVSDAYKADFMRLQKNQVDQLVADGASVALQLLNYRIRATGCRPVYLGHISGFDHGKPPWTFFKKAIGFGAGSDSEVDDEDSFGEREW